tara:strand:- start:201 stop:650 length:450 start_codon:yes stop_codon:yes gene_type:complete
MQQTSVSGTQDADVYSETYKLLMSGWGLFNKVAQLLGTKNSELFVYLYVKKFPPIELDKEEKKQLSLKQEESTPRVEALKKALEIFEGYFKKYNEKFSLKASEEAFRGDELPRWFVDELLDLYLIALAVGKADEAVDNDIKIICEDCPA